MCRGLVLAAILLASLAAAEDKKPGPEVACQDDYTECVETCDIDYGMDETKKKLKKCVKKCTEDRKECLDRFRFHEGEPKK